MNIYDLCSYAERQNRAEPNLAAQGAWENEMVNRMSAPKTYKCDYHTGLRVLHILANRIKQPKTNKYEELIRLSLNLVEGYIDCMPSHNLASFRASIGKLGIKLPPHLQDLLEDVTDKKSNLCEGNDINLIYQGMKQTDAAFDDLNTIIQRLENDIYSADDVVDIIGMICKGEEKRTDKLQYLFRIISDRLGELSIQGLEKIIFYYLNLGLPYDLEITNKFFQAVMKKDFNSLEGLKLLISIAFTASQHNIQLPHKLWGHYLQLAVDYMDILDAKELSFLLWGVAKLDIQVNNEFFEEWDEAAKKKIADFTLEGLVNVLEAKVLLHLMQNTDLAGLTQQLLIRTFVAVSKPESKISQPTAHQLLMVIKYLKPTFRKQEEIVEKVLKPLQAIAKNNIDDNELKQFNQPSHHENQFFECLESCLNQWQKHPKVVEALSSKDMKRLTLQTSLWSDEVKTMVDGCIQELDIIIEFDGPWHYIQFLDGKLQLSPMDKLQDYFFKKYHTNYPVIHVRQFKNPNYMEEGIREVLETCQARLGLVSEKSPAKDEPQKNGDA